MAGLFKIKIEGIADLVKRINALEGSVRKKANREAMRGAGAEVRKDMRARVPRRVKYGGVNVSGTMRRSVKSRVKSYRRSGVVVCMVGVARKQKRQIGVRVRDGAKSKKGDPIFMVPSKIYHLVEFGTKRSRARSFVRRAEFAARAAVQRRVEEVYRKYVAQAGR